MISVFLPQYVKMIIIPAAFVPSIIAPVIYSYNFYRKQCLLTLRHVIAY